MKTKSSTKKWIRKRAIDQNDNSYIISPEVRTCCGQLTWLGRTCGQVGVCTGFKSRTKKYIVTALLNQSQVDWDHCIDGEERPWMWHKHKRRQVLSARPACENTTSACETQRAWNHDGDKQSNRFDTSSLWLPSSSAKFFERASIFYTLPEVHAGLMLFRCNRTHCVLSSYTCQVFVKQSS